MEYCRHPKALLETTPGRLTIRGVQVHRLPIVNDLRGSLSFGEYERHLPFQPRRYFIVYDVPSREVRGEHAHRRQQQFLTCLRGSCTVVADDGKNRDEIVLDNPGLGLHIEPMVWATLHECTPDAVLLVLASDAYDAGEYIRDYDEFLDLAGSA